MRRKVILFGGCSHVLSLPSLWVKKYGISKGDEIHVEERGSSLVINSGKAIENKAARITGGRGIAKRLSGLYCAGYDEIEVRLESKEDIRLVEGSIRRRLMGFEVVHVRGRDCVIRDISSARLGEFDNILRRVFIMLCSLEGSYRKDYVENALKLCAFCKRCLSKKEYVSHTYSMGLFALVTELERIASVWGGLGGRGLGRASGSLRKINELFYSFDNKKAEEACRSLNSRIRALVRKGNPDAHTHSVISLARNCLNALEIISSLHAAA
ncbi:MAG: hypothetical protein ABIB71_02140 [Candidatus Woesearchaeota archaeon]